MEDSTRPAVLAAALAAAQEMLGELVDRLRAAPGLDLGTAEELVLAGVRDVGARLLAAALAGAGRGHAGPRRPCACGGAAAFEGYRRKEVQTRLGWVTLRRAYYH